MAGSIEDFWSNESDTTNGYITNINSNNGSSSSSNIILGEVLDLDSTQHLNYSLPVLYNVTAGYFSSTSSLAVDASNATASADRVSKNMMVPSLMFFFGVFGNILALVILTVKPSKDSKSTAFYHLVKALVYMDLFGIVATSPVTIVVYLNGGVIKTGGPALCHYFSFMLMLAGNATVFTVLVMAGERFMVTKYPFQYSRLVRPMAVNLTIGLVWGLSSLVAILPIIGVGENKPHWPGTWCFFDYRSTNVGGQILSFFYASTGLLAIIITIILNITVIKHLWSMRRTRLHATFRSSSRSFPGHEKSSGGSEPDSELRMVVFLMAIIVVFSVCYVPLMVRIIMNEMLNAGLDVPPGGVEDKLDIWSLRLACLNQILDPWVYIISRVTCCKSQRDSARKPLRSQQTEAHIITPNGTPSHIRRNTAVSNCTTATSAQSSPQCPRKQANIFFRTLGAIRVLFKQRKPRKAHDSPTARDPETSTVPLNSSSPPAQIRLAGRNVSTTSESSFRLYDDGVC